MALASGKKCIAVSSTEALARSCENATKKNKNETLIVPAIDARNNRVFAQAAEDDTLRSLLAEDAYDADAFVAKIEKIPEIIYGARRQIIVVGSGANVMKKAFEKAKSGLNIYYAPGAAIMPKGVALAAFASGKLIDARDLKASYCAVSQAERLKKNG